MNCRVMNTNRTLKILKMSDPEVHLSGSVKGDELPFYLAKIGTALGSAGLEAFEMDELLAEVDVLVQQGDLDPVVVAEALEESMDLVDILGEVVSQDERFDIIHIHFLSDEDIGGLKLI